MKKILFSLFLISILTFSSCTIGGSYYLINQTGEDLVITFEFENSKNYFSKGVSQIKTSKYKGRKIKSRKIKKMTKVVTQYDTSNNTLQFILGKDEYAFIGGGSNYYDYFRFYAVKKVLAKGDKTLIELNKNQTSDKVKVKTRSGGFLHYVRTYTLVNN